MRKGIGVLALLLLLAGLGVGGFYFYQGRLPWEPPAPAPPPPAVPAPVTPEAPATPELPAPTLTTEQPPAPGAAPSGAALATLAGIESTVKSKRASDLTWEDARTGMSLYEDDAVRTFEKSSATISFGPNDIIEVDQNALVVIKPRTSSESGNEISLALLSADLLKSLEARPAAEQRQAIATAASQRTVTLRPAAAVPGKPAAPTRVAVRAMPDRTTSVAALSGSLTIVSPKGKEVVLKEKTVTRISDAGLATTPRVLPTSPDLLTPRDGETYPFLRRAPRVSMSWKTVPGARGYRVVVSNDASFRKIALDERIAATTFDAHIPQPGTYYWRVRAQDADGFDGPYSAPRSVKAVLDETPPKLSILSPAEMFISPSPSVEVRGQTERDARVKINGQKVDVGGDGAFHLSLTLKEGVNLVTIEAADAAGNTEYARRVITYKGTKRSTASVSGNP